MTDDRRSTEDVQARVAQYREVVLEYEAVSEEIARLMDANNGSTENMSDEEFDTYREMAWRRDRLYNQMKWFERRLLEDE
jgi:hypothetical protein